MSGNNVSHANNKTKRRFLPNLQNRRFWVESENRWVRLRVSNAGLRLIDKNGIDSVLADLRARGEASPRSTIMAKGARDKIKLESTAGTGHFYDHEEQAQHAGKDGDQEVRSRRPQACGIQRNQDQVISGFC